MALFNKFSAILLLLILLASLAFLSIFPKTYLALYGLRLGGGGSSSPTSSTSSYDDRATGAQSPFINASQHSNKVPPSVADLKVYISMTTIKSRLYGIPATIKTLLQGSVLPDAIFVFISKDPYLLDEGVTFSDISTHLESLADLSLKFNTKISIEYTENIGPHRKLLPLLRRVIDEDDCVIVTVDDHEIYKPQFLNSLLLGFEATGQASVVALRVRIMGVCKGKDTDSPWNISPYMSHDRGIWPEFKQGTGHDKKLLLPTGNGGVLYHPRFFRNKIVFDREFINATRTADDILFRLSTLSNGVNVVQVKLTDYPIVRRHTRHHYSSVNNSFEIVDSNRKYSLHDINVNASNSEVLHFSDGSMHSHSSNFGNANLNRSDASTAVGLKLRSRSLSATEEWKNSKAKKISLATMFNKKGGNDAVIHSGMKFLKSRNIYDFEKELQLLIAKERPDCLKKFDLLETAFGWSHFTSHAMPFLMDLWSNQCGLTICEFD